MNTQTKKYVKSSKYPLRFDVCHPGSLFKIVSEPSRGIKHANDPRMYRKARDHEGFYATVEGDTSKTACLMPFDIVQPYVVERANHKAKQA
jgi:hypothetical protein